MTHIMTLESTHEGTEEWRCHSCGRVLLMEWNPWRRIVVEIGDMYAIHIGGKGLAAVV